MGKCTHMHGVVVACPAERGEAAKECDWLPWLSDGEAEVVGGELRHDGEAAVEVVQVEVGRRDAAGVESCVYGARY
jgi:hypothetical protein